MSRERWRPVLQDHYAVSSLGRLKRLLRRTCGVPGKVLRGFVSARGYELHRLSVFGVAKTHQTHRLVAAAFIGECPRDREVNHKNGVKTDNRAANLEYTTKSEQARHAFRLGLRVPTRGVLNGRAKLSERSVLKIRELKARGERSRAVALRFRIARETVDQIARRATWRHV